MAYTTKLIMALPSELATQVKAYLDSQSPTSIHGISITKSGAFLCCLIVFE